jgi:hypothetical protein
MICLTSYFIKHFQEYKSPDGIRVEVGITGQEMFDESVLHSWRALSKGLNSLVDCRERGRLQYGRSAIWRQHILFFETGSINDPGE